MAPPPPPHDLPSRLPQQARPKASYPCLPSSSSANRGKTPGRQTGPPPRPPPEAPLAIPSNFSTVARGGLEGPGREVGEACRGYLPRHEPGVKRLWGEVGPWGEVPVSVVRHREEKARDPAQGGELVLGVGFASPLPFLPLGQA
jgi:hypothetical protein